MLLDTTYTEFKNSFYDRTGDLSILDGGDFNALKIVLDGLKVQYHKRGIKNHYLFEASWKKQFAVFLKKGRSHAIIEKAKAELALFREKKILINSLLTKSSQGE